MNKLKLYFIVMKDRSILINTIKISLIVGTILNLINQGSEIVNLDYENISYIKLIFTYSVPFLVSSYTAFNMKIKFQIGDTALTDAKLECQMCKIRTNVLRYKLVPICVNYSLLNPLRILKRELPS